MPPPNLLDDLVKDMMKEEGGGAGTPLQNPVALGRPDPFPRNAQGQLTNPQYIQTEGERIRKSLEEGTYGEQPLREARNLAGEPQITIAPASGLLEGQPPIVFEQSNWNIDPAQEMQNLRLDELRTRAAQHKLQLENERTGLPRTELEAAQLEHTLAATRAIGTTERRRALENAKAMQDVAGFNEFMMNAPEPGTPEYLKHVRTAIAKYPTVATTAFGTQELGRTSKGHDILSAVAEATAAAGKPPPGMVPKTIHGGPGGGSVSFEPEDKGKNKYVDIIRNAVKVNVGTPEAEYNAENPTKIKADRGGTHVAIVDAEGKTHVIPVYEYLQAGGRFDAETLMEQQKVAAKKALVDPKATPEQRSMARKLIGVFGRGQ